MRNLEGVASTVQAAVKEYQVLEARQQRTVHMLAPTIHELQSAEDAVAMITHARASEASKAPLATLGPGIVVISIEEYGIWRSGSACVRPIS